MRHGLAALIVLSLTGLAVSALAEPKAPVDPSLTASDTTLLQDSGKATAELQQRLRGQVAYRNGVLVITDRSGAGSGVTVMPATAMWGVDCGENGVAVTFGTGSGDSDNGVVLQLTSVAVSDAQCMTIAPAIGEATLAITKGN